MQRNGGNSDFSKVLTVTGGCSQNVLYLFSRSLQLAVLVDFQVDVYTNIHKGQRSRFFVIACVDVAVQEGFVACGFVRCAGPRPQMSSPCEFVLL